MITSKPTVCYFEFADVIVRDGLVPAKYCVGRKDSLSLSRDHREVLALIGYADMIVGEYTDGKLSILKDRAGKYSEFIEVNKSKFITSEQFGEHELLLLKLRSVVI